MTTKDYSQYGEQAAILHRFLLGEDPPNPGAKLDGRFLDIGAWSPTTFSNTRALFERGWDGVMFEPSPRPMIALLDEYGNTDHITLIQACVSVEGGLAELFVTDDAVSTTRRDQYDAWKDKTAFHGRMLVPSVTVADIGQRFGGFDFVNIDAEGQSADIFLEFMRLGMFPPCVCVEHDSRTTELIAAATSKGYQVVFGNATNLVLVHG